MTAENKKMEKLLKLILVGVSAGIWKFVAESAFALQPQIGEEILKIIEKDDGFKITGEKPVEILTQIGNFFVENYSFASEINIEAQDNIIQIKAKNCVSLDIIDMLQEAGVSTPFTCPIMNASIAALKRININAHTKLEKWEAENGIIISLALLT